MKVVIDGKEYFEKEETFYEVRRLINQDRADMSEEERDVTDIVMQRLQNILFLTVRNRKENIMGVNIIFNGHMYHFEEDAGLDNLLEETADSVEETERENAVLYDDEL